MSKLELNQLKNYLGNGVKSVLWFDGHKLERDLTLLNITTYIEGDTESRLLFYRLSDLDKMIPELGFVPIEELLRIKHNKHDWFEKEGERYSSITVEQVPNFVRAFATYLATFEIKIWKSEIESESFWVIQKLFEWNFWVFDQSYFDEGLIIDKLKNTQS